MKKMLKTIIITVIIAIMVILVSTTQAAEELDANIELECNDEIVAGSTITIKVKVSEVKKNIDTLIGVLEYDEEIFEEITEDDLEPLNKWNYPVYNAEDKIFLIEKTGGTTTDEEILNINLKVKENVTETTTIVKVVDIEVAGLGIDLVVDDKVEKEIGKTEEVDPTPDDSEPEPTPGEKLYLSTEIYKIGNEDIENYEEGDKYISRVEKETTKEEFIKNLKTNGTIKIIKHDGTELGENELVGTGMTIEVTKEEEKIELQIAVMGDLDGNGKITATDLSTLNQTILKTVTLEKEYKIAGDLDENEKITATDLSTLNKMLLKIL